MSLLALQTFSFAHIAILFFGVILALLVGQIVRNDASSSVTMFFVRLCAFATFLSYPISMLAWSFTDQKLGLETLIPFHLCDVTAIICGAALFTNKRLLMELAYFWGIAGAMQALLTPALPEGSTFWTTASFFQHHISIVVGAVIVSFGLHWRSEFTFWKLVGRQMIFINVYVFFAMLLNTWLKTTNFGFLAKKPITPSLLDHMGPWPFYIIGMEIGTFLVFLLLAWPVCRKK